jgi:hypothetical protein
MNPAIMKSGKPHTVGFGAFVELGERRRSSPPRLVEGTWIRRRVHPPDLSAFLKLVIADDVSIRERCADLLRTRPTDGLARIVSLRPYDDRRLGKRTEPSESVQNPPEPDKVGIRPRRPDDDR